MDEHDADAIAGYFHRLHEHQSDLFLSALGLILHNDDPAGIDVGRRRETLSRLRERQGEGA
jgi:hypothetical protein